MILVSLESPEFATFVLGSGVDYATSKPLALKSPTKMTDIVVNITSKEIIDSPIPLTIRISYCDKTNFCHRINHTNPCYRGQTKYAINNPSYDDFICEYLKFEYEHAQQGETKEFLITVEKFQDEKEKMTFYAHALDMGLYKDEI